MWVWVFIVNIPQVVELNLGWNYDSSLTCSNMSPIDCCVPLNASLHQIDIAQLHQQLLRETKPSPKPAVCIWAGNGITLFYRSIRQILKGFQCPAGQLLLPSPSLLLSSDMSPSTDSNSRVDRVRNAFEWGWLGYQRFSWGQDELRPLSFNHSQVFFFFSLSPIFLKFLSTFFFLFTTRLFSSSLIPNVLCPKLINFV